jgi:integrase
MGKRWRKYANGPYRLGQLNGQAVVCWRDDAGPHRVRLDAWTEAEGRSEVDAFARKRTLLTAIAGRSIAEIYAAYQDDREKDGKLIQAFRESWRALAPTFGKLTPDDITADLCRRYTKERCIDQGRSQGTAWTELQRLRSCMNWALKKRLISFKPDVWVPQKPPPKDRVLTVDEVDALLAGCMMPHIKLFVILALATAGRSSALLELEWTRVDFEAGIINLRVPEVINPLTKKARKGRSVVPMNEWARVALLEARQGALTDFVIEWNGERVRSVRKGFSEAVRRAGLGKDVTPHTLRHTAASWMESGGIPMAQISRFLGHSNENVTRNIYAKPDTTPLLPAAEIVDLQRKRVAPNAGTLR